MPGLARLVRQRSALRGDLAAEEINVGSATVKGKTSIAMEWAQVVKEHLAVQAVQWIQPKKDKS